MNKPNNIITDQELHELFKVRLLEQGNDDVLNQQLLDMETLSAFTSEHFATPDAQKEQALLRRLNKATGFGPASQWFFIGLSGLAIVIASVLLLNSSNEPTPARKSPVTTQTVTTGPSSINKQAGISGNNKPLAAALPLATATTVSSVTDMPVQDGADSTAARQNYMAPVASNYSYPYYPGPAPSSYPSFYRQPNIDSVPANRPYARYTGPAPSTYPTNKRSLGDSGTVSIDTVFYKVKRVEVNGAYCNINVSTHPQNEVNVKGELKLEAKGLVFRKPDFKVRCQQNDSVLKVWIENEKHNPILVGGSLNYDGYINIELPSQTAVIVKNSSGSIMASGLGGNKCDLNSSYGNIVAENISANADIRASSGNIDLKHVTGNVVCHTAYGHIKVNELVGNARIDASSGNVQLADITGSVQVHSSYGNIDINRLKGDLNLNASSGSVRAEAVEGARMIINTTYGSVTLSNIRAQVIVRAQSGKINLQNILGEVVSNSTYGTQFLSGISGNVVLTSSSGNVELQHLKGNLNVNTTYGDVTAGDCRGSVMVKAQSGNIKGKDIDVVRSLYLVTSHGDINMNLKNNIDSLRFDLESGSGRIQLNKNGVKLQGNGKLNTGSGNITVHSSTSSGNLYFD